MKCITYRIDDNKRVQLKDYCTVRNVSIQQVLDDYITTLLSESGNAGKSPGEVKNTAMYCPYCGKDING